MTDETFPPGWPPRSQTWPRWLPDPSWNGGFTPPASPNDHASVQSGPIWVETPSGGLLALHPNGANWVETPNGGLLAVHPQPRLPSQRGGSHWWDSIAAAPAMPGAGGWPSPNPTSAAPSVSPPQDQPNSVAAAPDPAEAETGGFTNAAIGRPANMSHCVPLYVRCQNLHGGKLLRNGKRCEDCFNMCILHGEWPFHYCPLPG
jgi:hypothetical protein